MYGRYGIRVGRGKNQYSPVSKAHRFYKMMSRANRANSTSSMSFSLQKSHRQATRCIFSYTAPKLAIKQEISACLPVCDSLISRNVHPIYFTFCSFVAEGQPKCSVKYGAIWTLDTFSINTLLKKVFYERSKVGFFVCFVVSLVGQNSFSVNFVSEN